MLPELEICSFCDQRLTILGWVGLMRSASTPPAEAMWECCSGRGSRAAPWVHAPVQPLQAMDTWWH